MKIISHSEVLGVRDVIFATDYINNLKSLYQRIQMLQKSCSTMTISC